MGRKSPGKTEWLSGFADLPTRLQNKLTVMQAGTI
jgi:hypothetical protein